MSCNIATDCGTHSILHSKWKVMENWDRDYYRKTKLCQQNKLKNFILTKLNKSAKKIRNKITKTKLQSCYIRKYEWWRNILKLYKTLPSVKIKKYLLHACIIIYLLPFCCVLCIDCIDCHLIFYSVLNAKTEQVLFM